MLIDLSAETIDFLCDTLASSKHDDPKSNSALRELIDAQREGVNLTEMAHRLNALRWTGGMVGHRIRTPKEIMSWLTGFGGQLAMAAEESASAKRERDELVRQRATVRDFLGTSLVSTED